jgi:hypothetical protein
MRIERKRTLGWIVAIELVTMPLLLHAAENASGPKGAPPAEGRSAEPVPAEHGPRRNGPVTATEERQIVEFVKTYMSQHYDRLIDLRDTHPRRYRITLRFLRPRVQKLQAMPEATRKAHLREVKLKVQIYKTTRAYQSADSEGQKLQFRRQLHDLLAEQFDIEQKLQAHRLEQLEEQLQRLKDELKHRSEHREKIITDRLEDILSGERPAWMRRARRHRPGHGRPERPEEGDPLGGE